jgi:hypothetical protein
MRFSRTLLHGARYVWYIKMGDMSPAYHKRAKCDLYLLQTKSGGKNKREEHIPMTAKRCRWDRFLPWIEP